MCDICGHEWPGEQTPVCPACTASVWEHTPGFIKPKHDPNNLPWAITRYRSVVTYDFVHDPSLFIHTIAKDAQYFYDTDHNNTYCFLQEGLGHISGSGIPANYPMPTHPLDSVVVVGALDNPHIFAEDSLVVQTKIVQGKLVPYAKCREPGCNNLAMVSVGKCPLHMKSR